MSALKSKYIYLDSAAIMGGKPRVEKRLNITLKIKDYIENISISK